MRYLFQCLKDNIKMWGFKVGVRLVLKKASSKKGRREIQFVYSDKFANTMFKIMDNLSEGERII